ncbi:alpha/beta hydrolase [Crateriforma conspicua]|uniref:alpha/beta hydrolase n=1 Tax=Crateriforma conspicua TaxID=2527996 RepID=UPI00118D237F|nr:alpha/beta hydrolase-fold protein [Crateriforma conspicua]QDV64198.1 Phospholipase/Carboxylesterase [Crateriforma conspicua]
MRRFHDPDGLSTEASEPSETWKSPWKDEPCGWSDDVAATTDSSAIVGEDSTDELPAARTFLLPLHYEPGYQYPLVIWLHNDGFNETQIEQVMPHISLRNYVGVGVRGAKAGDAIGHRFDWSDTEAAVQSAWRQINSAIDESKRRFAIHPDRIVLAGYRSGGTMALRLALRHPEVFAGVISLGGALPTGRRLFSDLNDLRRQRLSMLWSWAVQGDHFHNTTMADNLRQMLMTKCRIEVRQYVDDDEMNTVTLSDVNEWIMNRIVAGNVCVDGEPETSPSLNFSQN